jgi:hypothetical protein
MPLVSARVTVEILPFVTPVVASREELSAVPAVSMSHRRLAISKVELFQRLTQMTPRTGSGVMTGVRHGAHDSEELKKKKDGREDRLTLP